MAATFSPLATVTVGSGGASTIDFSNIPSSYTDLCVLLSLRSSDTGFVDPNIKFNNTNTNKTNYYFRGSGSSYGGGEYPLSIGTIPGANKTVSTFASTIIYIAGYSNTSINKAFTTDTVNEDNATLAYTTLMGGIWASTDAINQITFAQNFVEYCTATLYSISRNSIAS